MIYVIDHKDSFTHNVVHQFSLFDNVALIWIFISSSIVRAVFSKVQNDVSAAIYGATSIESVTA